MSHNISLSGVVIKDLDLLGEIVAEKSGGKATLEKGVTSFRTYRGQSTTCDARINMPGPHDVGLVYDAEKGGYTTKFDPYAMDTCLAHPQGDMRQYGDYHIGAVLQEYTLKEAEISAAQRGFSSRRIEREDGTVSLELVAA